MATEQDDATARDQQRTEEVAAALLLAAVSHERFASDMTARVMERFRDMEADLVRVLAGMDILGQPNRMQQRIRATALADEGEDVIFDAYDDIVATMTDDLRTVAETAEGSVINALVVSYGAEYAVKHFRTVPIERLHAIADDALFEGATVAAWFEQQAVDAEFRFRRCMVEAVSSGSDEAELIEVIRGSRESRRTDGIFQQVRRNAEALVRTAVQAVATAARLATYEANGDTVRMVGQHSILDSRTSEVCIAYSGKKWSLPDYEPVGHSLPFNGGTPRHWRCRSSIIPIFGDAEVPGGSYEEWLKTRDEEEQRDVLGALKWKLWTSGKLSPSDLLDQRGNPLSSTELTRRFSRKVPD